MHISYIEVVLDTASPYSSTFLKRHMRHDKIKNNSHQLNLWYCMI